MLAATLVLWCWGSQVWYILCVYAMFSLVIQTLSQSVTYVFKGDIFFGSTDHFYNASRVNDVFLKQELLKFNGCFRGNSGVDLRNQNTQKRTKSNKKNCKNFHNLSRVVIQLKLLTFPCGVYTLCDEKSSQPSDDFWRHPNFQMAQAD